MSNIDLNRPKTNLQQKVLPVIGKVRANRIYEIKDGDTLGKIAKRNESVLREAQVWEKGDSVWEVTKKLAKINNFKNDRVNLLPGQKIKIPILKEPNQSGTLFNSSVVKTVNGRKIEIMPGVVRNYPEKKYYKLSHINYRVKKGDTLGKIVGMHEFQLKEAGFWRKNDNLWTVAKKIERLNKTSASSLSIGETIKIPAFREVNKEPFIKKSIIHTVSKGETLGSIAAKYKKELQESGLWERGKSLWASNAVKNLASKNNIDLKKPLRVGDKITILETSYKPSSSGAMANVDSKKLFDSFPRMDFKLGTSPENSLFLSRGPGKNDFLQAHGVLKEKEIGTQKLPQFRPDTSVSALSTILNTNAGAHALCRLETTDNPYFSSKKLSTPQVAAVIALQGALSRVILPNGEKLFDFNQAIKSEYGTLFTPNLGDMNLYTKDRIRKLYDLLSKDPKKELPEDLREIITLEKDKGSSVGKYLLLTLGIRLPNNAFTPGGPRVTNNDISYLNKQIEPLIKKAITDYQKARGIDPNSKNALELTSKVWEEECIINEHNLDTRFIAPKDIEKALKNLHASKDMIIPQSEWEKASKRTARFKPIEPEEIKEINSDEFIGNLHKSLKKWFKRRLHVAPLPLRKGEVDPSQEKGLASIR